MRGALGRGAFGVERGAGSVWSGALGVERGALGGERGALGHRLLALCPMLRAMFVSNSRLSPFQGLSVQLSHVIALWRSSLDWSLFLDHQASGDHDLA